MILAVLSAFFLNGYFVILYRSVPTATIVIL